MEIILTEGCICDSLEIDGKESSECTSEELIYIIKKILDKEKSKFNLIKLLGEIIEIFGDYETDEHCAYCQMYNCSDCDYGKTVGDVKTDKYGSIVMTTIGNDETIAVNNKDINDFDEDEIRDIIIEIVNSGEESVNLVWTLRGLIKDYGKYKFCYHCDECGDNVVEYKLKI